MFPMPFSVGGRQERSKHKPDATSGYWANSFSLCDFLEEEQASGLSDRLLAVGPFLYQTDRGSAAGLKTLGSLRCMLTFCIYSAC